MKFVQYITKALNAVWFFALSAFALVGYNLFAVIAEKQGYTPYTCKSNYGVDDTAQQHTASAKNPCHQVETEKTDKSPVNTTDYGKYKTDFVEHNFTSLINAILLV